MNKEQRKNLAKTIFDCSKIIFAVAIATPLVSPEVNLWKVALGIIAFALFLAIGVLIDKGE